MDSSIVHGIEIKHETMPSFWEQASTGQWEPFTFECIKQHVEPGSVFLDIGSWNGVFSVYADKLGAKTYAFEPDPVAFDELTMLTVLNSAYNVSIFRTAISDSKGVSTLNNMGDSFGNSESSLINRGNIKNELTVETDTLKNYADWILSTQREISFIKMDVEGNEIKILTEPGTKKFIKNKKPTMHVSFHPAWLPDLEKDIDSILYLFDVYHAVTDKGTICTRENFKDVLNTGQHAILFTSHD
jgi:FkbM family methyltransferase